MRQIVGGIDFLHRGLLKGAVGLDEKSAQTAVADAYSGQMEYTNGVFRYFSSISNEWEKPSLLKDKAGSAINLSSQDGLHTEIDIVSASAASAGSMSAAHYTLLASGTASAAADTIVVRDANGGANFGAVVAQKLAITDAPVGDSDAVRLIDLNALKSGIKWRNSVSQFIADHNTVASPTEGMRVVNSTDKKIYTYSGGSWDGGVSPQANWSLFDGANETGYTYDEDGADWVQFTSAGQVGDGNGLTKNGNTLNVGEGQGITVSVDAVSMNASSDNFGFDPLSGALIIKDGGISMTHLDNLNGSGIKLDNGKFAIDTDNVTTGIVNGKLAVLKNYIEQTSVDNATIVYDATDGLKVKDDGIGMTQLKGSLAGAAINFDNDKINVSVDDSTIQIITDSGNNHLAVKYSTDTNAFANAASGALLDAAAINAGVVQLVSDSLTSHEDAYTFVHKFTTVAGVDVYTASDNFQKDAKFVQVAKQNADGSKTIVGVGAKLAQNSTEIDLGTGGTIPAGEVYHVLIRKSSRDFL